MDNPTPTLLDAGTIEGLQLNSIPAPRENSEVHLVFPEFKYRDTAVNGWNNRNDVRESFHSDPSMVNTGQTVFRFTSEYLDRFNESGSVRGYNGSCYSDYLPLDLDCNDLEQGLKTVQEFLQYLDVEYEIPPASIPVWFSGNKGFHLAIPIAMFGQVEPTPQLPKYYRQFVETQWSDWGFDTAIYDINRLFRSENTQHGSSGLYKVRVNSILDTDLDSILELAKQPGKKTEIDEYYDVQESAALVEQFRSIMVADQNQRNTKKKQELVNWQLLIQQEAGVGNRNDTAFKIALGMHKVGFPKESVLENLHGWNRSLTEPLPEREIENVVTSAFKYITARSVEAPLPETCQRSDYGNAQLFAELHGNTTRYDHTRKKWYLYNGQFWNLDKTEQVLHLAKDVARKRQELAMAVASDEERKKDLRWAIGAENLSRFNSMLSVAEAFDPIAITADAWEGGDWLIQFENGVYDLETATFRDGLPEDMNYQSTGFNYDPQATCPVWEDAILEMMDNDPEMVSFLQHAIGYSLTGSTREQCLFILTGYGCNGKSVVLDTLLHLLHEYGMNSPFSAFEVKNNEQSNELARLVGARLVSSSESSQTRKLNEERIKMITGGDKVTARFLYQEHFTYTPKFKLWFAVNTLPEIRGTDNGIWRRIKVIPFDVSFKGREDFELTDKLLKELPGIMNWAIRGAHLWIKNGLPEPHRVKSATNEYRSESDIVAVFLDEKVIKNPAQSVKASKLYATFRDHCIRSGQHAMSVSMFGRQMRQLGYDKRKSNGAMIYDGVGLELDDPYDGALMP